RLVARPGVDPETDASEPATLGPRPLENRLHDPAPRVRGRTRDPVQVDVLAALELTPDGFVLVGDREHAGQSVVVHDAEESSRLDFGDCQLYRQLFPA